MLRSVFFLVGAAMAFTMGCSVSLTGPSGGHSTAKKPAGQKPRPAAEPSAAEEPPTASQDLGELPSVDQVVNDLRVPAARETAARTAVGLNTLSFLASESGDNAKASEYSVAAAAIIKAEQAKYDLTCKAYNCDENFFTKCRNVVYFNDSFRGEIANRYLSSARKQQLLAKFKDPRSPAHSNISILKYHDEWRFKPQGQLGKTWCSDEPASRAPTITAASLAGENQAVPAAIAMMDADTSAAKGKAAGTDMSFLGLALGEELDLPSCGGPSAHQLCHGLYDAANAPEWLESIRGEQPHDIHLLRCPDFVASCTVTALVKRVAIADASASSLPDAGAKKLKKATKRSQREVGGGTLVQVKVHLLRDKAINANLVEILTKKYKQAPTSKEVARCQNAYGAQQSAILHEWAVPGIHATLVMDDCKPHGLFEPPLYYLKIETETHYAARASIVEASKPRL